MSMLKSRLGLIIPLAIFVVVVLVYAVVWNRAAATLRQELAKIVAAETTAGHTLLIGTTKVKGFPFNLRGELDDVVYDRRGLGRYEAERVLIATLPQDISRVILTPRGEQSLTFAGETYALEAEDLRVSLERGAAALETHRVSMVSDQSTMRIETLIGNLQQLGDASSLALGVRGFARDGEAAMDVPVLDLAASIDGDTLTVASLGLYLGENNGEAASQIAGDGALTFAEDGRASGQFDLSVQNQDPLIGVLASTGVINSTEASGAKLVLGLMTDNGKEPVDLPFTVKDGKMKLGPISVGRLPPIPL